MTTVTRVSQQEMARRTGFERALGYSLPQDDEILVRHDLPKVLEHAVLKHEEDHMDQGEEGPFPFAALLPFLPAVGSAVGGFLSGRGASDAGEAAAGASDAATAEQRRQFDIAAGLSQPSIDAGNVARDQLLRLLGLAVPESQPVSNDRRGQGFRGRRGLADGFRGQFGLDAQQGASPASAPFQDPMDIIRNTPGFEFITEQGTRGLNVDRSGGGTSGGSLIKDFTRFNEGVAGDFYRDYANRLANVAGTGQVAALGAGNQAITSGNIVGNSLQNAGLSRATGIQNRADIFGGVAEDISRIFGDIFSKKNPGGSRWPSPDPIFLPGGG